MSTLLYSESVSRDNSVVAMPALTRFNKIPLCRSAQICALVCLLSGVIYSMPAQSSLPASLPVKSWRELADSKNIAPVNGAFYYEFALPNGSNAHLVVAYLKEGKWRIRPFVSEKTAATSRIAASQNASAAINGGFFNLSDGASASHITLDSKPAEDPHNNRALVDNPKLKPFLAQIFNRSELRILQRKGKKKTSEIQICRHDEPVPAGFELLDALQAGPRLLPTLEDESEAFVRKQEDGTVQDSISCRKPAARSAFGVTADGYAIMLAVSGKGQDKESSGVTLAEMADLMKRLGCRQAINLDGGSSTSMYVRLSSEKGEGRTVCAKEPETLVKSVILLLPQ